MASAFLLSVPLGRPLAQRLAADFCPIPPHVMAAKSLSSAGLTVLAIVISVLWFKRSMTRLA